MPHPLSSGHDNIYFWNIIKPLKILITWRVFVKCFRLEKNWAFLANRKDLSNIQIYNLIFLFCLFDNSNTAGRQEVPNVESIHKLIDLGRIINFAP